MKSRFFCAIAVFLSITGFAASATLTVATNGTGDYTTIQAALNAAVGGVDEVVVANGTYTGPGNRNLDFKGKAVVLRSIGGAANCIIDCQGQGRGFIFERGEGSGTIVDGFTIINGYHPNFGGAIECDGSSPVISNCIITNCSSYDGGAIDCYNASPIIAYCTLTNNHATNDGGAIECYDKSNPTITDCIISGNTAGRRGGGIDSYDSSPMIVNSQFLGNTAGTSGGGIASYLGSSPVITNCLLAGNAASRYGGAIDCYSSNAKIAYCTIVDNVGGEAFGGFGGVYADALSTQTTVTNSILWNNGDDVEGCSATYSCIQEGDGGEGNISQDPRFRTGTLGNYYLSQGAAGQQTNSPCVNAGSSDLVTPEFDPSAYTTRTDNVPDADAPDMGYHYVDEGPVEEFELTIGVLGEPDNANGTLVVRPNIVGTFPFYRKYAEVRLRATPDINGEGYRVGQWTGLQPQDIYSAPDARDVTIVVTGDRDVRVEFVQTQMYVLTTRVLDTGEGVHGTITAQTGAPADEPGQTWQYAGSRAIVTAVADAGYQVRFWTGTDNDAQYAGAGTAFATMLSDKTVTVEFVPDAFVRLDVQVVGGNGNVIPKRKTYDRANYPDEWPVVQMIQAIPDEGYRVLRWTGTNDDMSTDLNNSVTMNWTKTVTVEFEPVPIYWLYTNVYSADGGIHGMIEPEDGPYPEGEEVELLVTPDDGWEVVRWYGTLYDDSTEPNNVVIIDGGDAFVFVELRETGLDEGWIVLERDPETPFATIQDAIDAAIDNDVVIVARGVYTGPGNVNLNISGNDYDPADANTLHPITVRSEFGPEATIIDCEMQARGFRFGSEVDNRFRVQGFTIRNGEANQGGALYYAADRDADPPVAATPIVNNCILEMNHAGGGGGAIWIEGVGADDAVAQDAEDAEYAEITDCIIRNNMTEGAGGGIHITNGASPRIVSTQIIGNQAGGLGGGVFSNAESLPAIINCLFTLNISGDIGGAIYLRDSDAIIRLCTIIYNEGLDTDDNNGPKGGIAARDSDPEINHCIIGRSGYAMVGMGTWGDGFTAGDDLFGCDAEYSCIENGDGGTGNISADPLHETGQAGDFYLGQIRAGQEFNSPCYNTGQENVLEALEDQYGLSHQITTSILNQLDVGNTDMGYHYPIIAGPPILRRLTMEVFGNGYMEYMSYTEFGEVYPGAPVTIYVAPGSFVDFMAYADQGYRVFRWTGTVDDYSTANSNYVTVYNDQTVRLEFEKTYVRTFNIPGDFSHTQVQKAINAARSGDTVVLHSGVYTGADIVIMGKDITLTSAYPNDPAYVAQTIFDFGVAGGTGMHIIGTGQGRCVLNGVTIANARFTGGKVGTPPGAGANGGSGMDIFGLSLTVDGSHIIANCVIRDATLSGREGGDGNDGQTENPRIHAGQGGWGSSVGGAGLYVGTSMFRYLRSGGMYPTGVMSPIITNCTITNCVAIAGDGGNGGNSPRASRAGDGGVPGRVFGGAVFCDTGTNATFIDCTITDNVAQGGIGGQGGDSAGDGLGAGWGGLSDEYDLYRTSFPDDALWFQRIGDPRQWTGNGGGIYIGGYAYDYSGGYSFPGFPGGGLPGQETHATLINCDIVNNITRGSISGRGGNYSGSIHPPFRHYQMPAYGAGFYAAPDVEAVLTDCQVVNNRIEPHPDGETYDDYHSANQYYGYGGGVCVHGAEQSKPSVIMADCHIAENFAPVGGGMYWIDAYMDVADSNMVRNRSFAGGGAYFLDSPDTFVTNCLVQGNNAVFQQPDGTAPDPGTLPIHGAGGGIYSFNSNALIADTTITQNSSSFSGGGVYLGGHPESIFPLLAMPELKNCLITDNTAAQDGGGLSVNFYADVSVNNCTIAHNAVTGKAGEGFGYGGGVHVASGSRATIKDSIVWYNRGSLGAQLAVAHPDEFSEETRTQIDFLYSTAGPFLDPDSFEELIFGDDADDSNSGGTITPTGVIIEPDTINAAFASGGQKAKIVVSLKGQDLLDIRKATDWKSPASVAILQQAVAQRQNAVLSTLSPAEFTMGQRYQNLASFSGEVTPAGLDKLASHPLVAHIEPERYFTPMMAQALPLANALVARQAYDGTGVSIAIVDSGIDYTHPMLGGQGLGLGGFPNAKVIGGHDFAMKDPDPMPDGEPHGTACAGIAAGLIGLNGDYIGGVAYGAKLYALKIADIYGMLSLSAGLAAWDWCLTNMYADPENPILVVSNSWGRYGFPVDEAAVADALYPALADAADALTRAGVTVMAASGNDGFAGQGISVPSALSDVISVGAVYDTTDQVTGYSNAGDLLDILAPGDPIATTDIVGAGGYGPGDYTQTFNGTSAATPFAAGCVASIQSAAIEKLGRFLTPREIRSLLVVTGTPVTDTKVLITKPRVNLGAALASMSSIPIYVQEDCELPGWDADNEVWDYDLTRNIFDEPDFVSGYYLNYDSPCVDAGSAPALELGMNLYTTRLDGQLDADMVDMGYHYRQGVPIYPVQVTVVQNAADPTISGLAQIELPDGSIVEGTQLSAQAHEGQEVVLRAIPGDGAFVKGWYDRVGRLVSTNAAITILVDKDNIFTVEFKKGRTVQVSGGGDVLRQAVLDAQNGDILIVAPGTYQGNIDVRGRKLKIVSVDPSNPDVMGATVINCGPGERGFIFDNGEDSQVVVSGFTIVNGGIPGQSGGAIYFGENTSPIIKNVRVANSSAVLANGGAFYIAPGSSPTFINVIIENCSVVAGSGGGVFIDIGAAPTFIECVITNCSAFDGAGGAVYSAENTRPVFIDCLFTENAAAIAGGAVFFSLRCESQITNCQFIDNTLYAFGDPALYYGNGGAVYYGMYNTVDVADSNFIGNTADHGGAIYFDRHTTGTVNLSLMSGNFASSDGGAVYMQKTNALKLTDCAIVENEALRGGGLFSIYGVDNVVQGSAFRDNMANRPVSGPIDPNAPGGGSAGASGSVAGFGGGLYVFGEDIRVLDSAFSMNMAGNSGGGLYLSGDSELVNPEVYPQLVNCLITMNSASQRGGGIACDWFARPRIAHCTIADNSGGLQGGGLSVAYDGQAEIIDSIVWANYATEGAQVAVVRDNELDPAATSVSISYSNIGPLANPDLVPDANELGVGLVITPMTSPTEMVEMLLGEGIRIVGVPSYTGAAIASGSFTGGIAAGIGIEAGIVLTTGDASTAPGPNGSDFATTVNNYPGDVDLDAIVGGGLFGGTNDAAVLEFDFETRGGSLFFNYVFASEEYNEFANSPFNDVFAFFLDGVNIALIPGTRTPVEINTINGGNPLGVNPNNPELYNNNDLSDGGPFFNIEYDGFTVVLTARAPNVGPGIHHIKLAIADVGDFALDSAVFIQAGSFSDTASFSPPVYVEDGGTLNGTVRYDFDPVAEQYNLGDYVISDNPQFTGDASLYGGDDPLLFVGGYMLSHIAAGQVIDSNCIGAGSMTAADAGLADGYTTRTDQVADVDVVDLGYHYLLFEPAEYMLTVLIDQDVIGGPYGTVTFVPEPIGYDPVTGAPLFKGGTSVEVIAVPNDGYRVRRWIGTVDAPAWHQPSATVLMNGDRVIRLLFELDVARNLLVPTVFKTIEEAVAAASPGDTIIVDPGIHYISSPDGIDFDGKMITLTSIAPDNQGVIAQTIIDCLGSRYTTKRAFHFHNGETAQATVKGFTIRNGYYHGALGRHAVVPGLPIDPDEDPAERFRAYGGESVAGDGYGGAILCENGSSPTFEHCVVTNSVVTGGYGGEGAAGANNYYNNQQDGQWGGHGGSGSGNGHGGAVAVRTLSNPTFRYCVFKDNTAMGGCGGTGGDGGNGNAAGAGGAGGDAFGFGRGGAIYADNFSHPVVEHCQFINNSVRWGIVGHGGARGQGDEGDPEAYAGANGMYLNSLYIGGFEVVSGGAVYYMNSCDVAFSDCVFTDNKAFEVISSIIQGFQYTELPIYTRGGAIYSAQGNNVRLERCEFAGNMGGAVYSEKSNKVSIEDCTFRDNRGLDQADYEVPGLVNSYYMYYGYSYYYLGSYYQADSRTSPGGALYVGPNGQATIQRTAFLENEAYIGGAVNTKSSASFSECTFSNNTASAYGGAVDAFDNTDPNRIMLDLVFDKCSFAGNDAAWGGAVHSHQSEAVFVDCYLANNAAQSGGGLFLSDGDLIVRGGVFSGNEAVDESVQGLDGIGGALAIVSSTAKISGATFAANLAEGNRASGGAIAFYGGDDKITHQVVNCLFTGNAAQVKGGAISASMVTEPIITNCTFVDNTAAAGGAIGCDWMSSLKATNSIFAHCSNVAVAEEDIGGSAMTFNLFYSNTGGDYGIYNSVPNVQTGLFTYPFVSKTGGPTLHASNLTGNPLFVQGPLGGYYLSHMAAGQVADSPAINRGNGTAEGLGMNELTTRTDGVPDPDVIDIGYHYPQHSQVPQYNLTVTVEGGPGVVSLNPAGPYYSGMVVTLTVQPQQNYRVKAWSGGTLNDRSRETTNLVVMDRDKDIIVYLDQPRILIVGSKPGYTSIQHAIDDALDGDIVQLQPGEYTSDTWGILDFYGKEITLTGKNPDSADVVASTIINGYGFSFNNVGPRTVLSGFTLTAGRVQLFSSSPTIRNVRFVSCNWIGGTPPSVQGSDGPDGGDAIGGAIRMYDSSPQILNCTFDGCTVTAGSGARGSDGVEGHQRGYDGGWAGRAYGGAVYMAWNSNPVFKNCTFTNCSATGGNGGDGGNGIEGAAGGRAGNWLWTESLEEYIRWSWAWDGWQWGDKLGDYGWFMWTGWYKTTDPWYQAWVEDVYDRYYDHWRYSGYGGAVYAEVNSNPKFHNCEFTDNATSGGVSGVNGSPAGWGPYRPLDIENGGGAVYIADGCEAEFVDCVITGNTADATPVDAPDDYYISFGGGILAENNSQVKLTNCRVWQNRAALGGGVYWLDSGLNVADCNFMGNIAYSGGAMYGLDGQASITGGFVHRNFAGSEDTSIVDIAGSGGGIYLASVTAALKDVQMFGNQANLSGGALFLSGPEPLETTVQNCLFHDNRAGRDGGGMSVNWFSESIISNCTFADNWATGYFGFLDPLITDPNQVPQDGDDDGELDFAGGGGALYCAYGSNVEVIDSIFWGNYAQSGRQITVGTGLEFEPRPSTLKISYSDVEGGRGEAAVLVEDGCVMLWDDTNILANPLFADGPKGKFYLSQPLAGQDSNSPCVNHGSNFASVLGMNRYTTRTDDAFNAYDIGVVDMGYHYRLDFTPDSCRFCDLHLDGLVELADLAIFAEQQWLSTCQGFDDCDGADLNGDNVVDLADFVMFASCWFAADTTAPDPAEWDMKPHSQPDGMEMSAAVALDAWFGDMVTYRFICTTDASFSSVPQQGYNQGAPNYRATPWYYKPNGTNMVQDAEYTFIVRVSDPAGNTAESKPASAIAKVEGDPPMPNPSQWATLLEDGVDGLPRVASQTSVSMVARTATDASGPVEYYFKATDATGTGPAPAGADDSGWQLSPVYEDTGLTAGVVYSYRVSTRDRYHTISGESPVASVLMDPAMVDFTAPPTPLWVDAPEQYFFGGIWWHFMSVEPVVDPDGNGEEYQWDCVDNSNLNRHAWRNDLTVLVPGLDYPDPLIVAGSVPPLPNQLWVRAGAANLKYRYRVRVRDQSPNRDTNVSAWTPMLSVP
ncbi:MAG: choice-of-anchor L domain-containing protein [Phycisphaerae bacterium]|nr:choice-of-anchor L domain-containing protein [Phycisphaerae bacterium]